MTQTERSKIITRIAPSPTGTLHVGTARAALFNFLFARQAGGKFITRIEDTDKERSTKEYEEDIVEGLEWLGITPDTLFRQSERTELYKEAIHTLIDSNKAFISKESRKDGGGEEVEVVRLRNPGTTITFDDQIRGEITFDTKELGDFVIARSVDDPLYHLAVVVDDSDMGVTHVIRGEDHISNTPRQILIGEALGYERVEYAHIPLILAPDRSKLSKRKGTTGVSEYRELGYLPEALVNYLALLGWNPGTDQEFFTIDELIKAFSIKNVQKGGAVFDIAKLNWFNAAYIKKLSPEKITEEIERHLPERTKKLDQYTKDRLIRASDEIVERIHTFKEVGDLAERGELEYYFTEPTYEVASLLPKEETDHKRIGTYLSTIIELLQKVTEESFEADTIKTTVWEYASEVGRGAVLWPMRFALSGKDRSPDPFTLAQILGKRETLKRLTHAQEMLENA